MHFLLIIFCSLNHMSWQKLHVWCFFFLSNVSIATERCDLQSVPSRVTSQIWIAVLAASLLHVTLLRPAIFYPKCKCSVLQWGQTGLRRLGGTSRRCPTAHSCRRGIYTRHFCKREVPNESPLLRLHRGCQLQCSAVITGVWGNRSSQLMGIYLNYHCVLHHGQLHSGAAMNHEKHFTRQRFK